MTKKEQKVGILGFGEVGQAIAKFYEKPFIKDLNRNDGLENCEVLNICIPYKDESFIDIVSKEINISNAPLVIIHSTLAPGTTKKISEKTKATVVHSPIRGVHPYLFEGIQTFVKYIGVENEQAGKEAQDHLNSLGIKTRVVVPAITSELAKLLDTTYYGLCIAWHGEMKKICDKEGVNLETIIDYNKTYNEGYMKLGKTNVVRPILDYPKDKIGGHCVIPNAKILKQHYQSEALNLILEYGQEDN
jgi:UDP-N-acetyl-D-mannosaminuronate dehydrogenase